MARAAVPRRLNWQVARVRSLVAESPTARSLVLDIPDWHGHRAGQHIDVRLTAEDGYQAQRSFSIASAPEEGTVAITVEEIEDGEVSPYLVEDVIVGDELEVRGPIGGPFTWSVGDGGPLALIAGGSGLVPLMSMLRHRAAQASTIETHALISVRTETDALYRAELLGLSPGEGLDVRWTYTRAQEAPPGGWTGRADAAMLAAVVPAPAASPRVFVCGPTGFVEHVATLLVDAGHDPLRVRTERFGPT